MTPVAGKTLHTAKKIRFSYNVFRLLIVKGVGRS
jgi:hypothetical protein